MLKYLKTCFSFLRVKHDKLIYCQWIMPIIVSCLITGVFQYLPVEPKIFGEVSLVSGINSLLGIMIGFYIASIAAIASFNRDSLDDIMAGTPPTLTIIIEGQSKIESLTRRRFFCIIFGYCAVISILIYMLGLLSNILLPSIRELLSSPLILEGIDISEMVLHSLKCLWLFVYFFLTVSLGCATALGLHYLIERIHR